MSKIIIGKVKAFLGILKEFPDIRYLGDPILRTKTKMVDIEVGKQIGQKLGDVLIKYRKSAGMGRGLAAPQIGIGKSVFVTFVNDELQVYINPKITERSKSVNYYREICISSGIMGADVQRPEEITLEWINLNGKKHTQKFDGFMARLLQHEEAHLRGVHDLDEAEPGSIQIATWDPFKEKLRKSKD